MGFTNPMEANPDTIISELFFDNIQLILKFSFGTIFLEAHIRNFLIVLTLNVLFGKTNWFFYK